MPFFKINRITPELILLTCGKCGEPHMIGNNRNENGTHLTFWNPETGLTTRKPFITNW